MKVLHLLTALVYTLLFATGNASFANDSKPSSEKKPPIGVGNVTPEHHPKSSNAEMPHEVTDASLKEAIAPSTKSNALKEKEQTNLEKEAKKHSMAGDRERTDSAPTPTSHFVVEDKKGDLPEEGKPHLGSEEGNPPLKDVLEESTRSSKEPLFAKSSTEESSTPLQRAIDTQFDVFNSEAVLHLLPKKKQSALLQTLHSDQYVPVDQLFQEENFISTRDLKTLEKTFRFATKYIERESKKIKEKETKLIDVYNSLEDAEKTILSLRESLEKTKNSRLVNWRRIKRDLKVEERRFEKRRKQFEKDLRELNEKRDTIAFLKQEVSTEGKLHLQTLRDHHLKSITPDSEIDLKVKQFQTDILLSLSRKNGGSLEKFNNLITQNKGLFANNPERAWYLLTKFFESRRFNSRLKSLMSEQTKGSELVKTKSKTMTLSFGAFGLGDVWLLSLLVKEGLLPEISADNPLVAFSIVGGVPDTFWVAVPVITALTGLSYSKYLSALKRKTLISKAQSLAKISTKQMLCAKSFVSPPIPKISLINNWLQK